MTSNRPTQVVVGLIGRKRAGKDTLAARLVQEHGFTRVAFADPLKAILWDMNPVVRGDMARLQWVVQREGWEAAKGLTEVRRLLQTLGVSVRDRIGPATWVSTAMTQVLTAGGPVVITDVRFPNEAAQITAAGGVLVRIVRDGLPQDAAAQHISETALDNWAVRVTIENNGTVGGLYASADVLARSVITN